MCVCVCRGGGECVYVCMCVCILTYACVKTNYVNKSFDYQFYYTYFHMYEK